MTLDEKTLIDAVHASHQCITDFLEVWNRHASYTTLGIAARELKRDALPLLKKAMKNIEAHRATLTTSADEATQEGK
jgi:hypothetical protein